MAVNWRNMDSLFQAEHWRRQQHSASEALRTMQGRGSWWESLNDGVLRNGSQRRRSEETRTGQEKWKDDAV